MLNPVGAAAPPAQYCFLKDLYISGPFAPPVWAKTVHFLSSEPICPPHLTGPSSATEYNRTSRGRGVGSPFLGGIQLDCRVRL
jgi:hypothetical protein